MPDKRHCENCYHWRHDETEEHEIAGDYCRLYSSECATDFLNRKTPRRWLSMEEGKELEKTNAK